MPDWVPLYMILPRRRVSQGSSLIAQWLLRNCKTNAAGLLLVSLIFKGNLQILGGKDKNYIYPYTHHSTNSSSVLDLFCVSRDKADLFSEVTVHLSDNSDHQPISVTLQGCSNLRPYNMADRWLTKKVEVIQNKRLIWTKVDT
uniref:Endonuclease/exonuclease/phosphatase domain-containing protein n=1 Tax=Micrurus lemniscatus lemniscatus TaxID=129467 RepID=A0A2D4H878_MICLE